MSTKFILRTPPPGTAYIAAGLPASVAASVGRSIVRHSTVVWQQTLILCRLLELDKKRGRIILKVGRPSTFVGTIKDLLAASELVYSFKAQPLLKTLEEADDARNILAHSMFVEWEGKLHVQVVRGTWENAPPELQKVKRNVFPEAIPINRALLTGYRNKIEKAYKETRKLLGEITAAQKVQHAARQQGILSDRRRPSRGP